GFSAFSTHGFTSAVMPYIDVAVGAFVIRTALGELRGKSEHGSVNWFDVASACVIFVDVAQMYKPYKAFQPAHLYFFAGVLLLARGFFGWRLPRMRKVVLDEKGVSLRMSLFHGVNRTWADLSHIDFTENSVNFVGENGGHRVSLRRVGNRKEVLDAIAEGARLHGIPVETIEARA
ncbi:MAG TPA: hypothetical protein VFO86_01020, partial [Terriglobia bacterium]|nr:hypothetical protein [Terriglobia bacterium]